MGRVIRVAFKISSRVKLIQGSLRGRVENATWKTSNFFLLPSFSGFLICYTDIMEPWSFKVNGLKFCPVHRAFYQDSGKSALGFKLTNIQDFFTFNLCKLLWGVTEVFCRENPAHFCVWKVSSLGRVFILYLAEQFIFRNLPVFKFRIQQRLLWDILTSFGNIFLDCWHYNILSLARLV